MAPWLPWLTSNSPQNRYTVLRYTVQRYSVGRVSMTAAGRRTR